MESPSVLTTSDKDLQPGQKVGEYVVEGKIGEGGFGSVFRAAHPLIGKLAAIKVLKRQYSADPEMVSRFVAEARSVNQIRHRNIIDIFAFGQLEDGRSYYVMELLDGAPLDVYLAEHGAMPLGDAIPVLRAVARALDAAHAKGIAHRDLKPENIFLAHESDGSVFPKLLDFGIAKLLGDAGGTAMHKTRTGAPIGTPYYMSPEQCRGRDVDHRTDIYAFGCVAYKLITGALPFDGEDYMDILLKQIGEDAAPPSSRLPGVPRAVDDAIAWMMRKDPTARPPNLITAMRALEDAAQAAGFEFVSDHPTGLHSAQRTPSALMPLPRTPTPGQPAHAGPGDHGDHGDHGEKGSPSWVNAATVDANRLGDALAATHSSELPAALPSPTMDTIAPRRRSRARLAIGLALVGAIGIGAGVFVMLRSNQTEPPAGDLAARGEPAAPPQPIPAPAIPPSIPPEQAPGPATGGEVPAAPRFVTIAIEGTPPNTVVLGPGGRTLGVAPGDIQLDRDDAEIVLTFTADGHVPATRKVTPSDDQTLQVTLEKKVDAVARTKGRAGKAGDGKRGKGKTGEAAGSDSDQTDSGQTAPKDDDKSGRDTLEDPFGMKGK